MAKTKAAEIQKESKIWLSIRDGMEVTNRSKSGYESVIVPLIADADRRVEGAKVYHRGSAVVARHVELECTKAVRASTTKAANPAYVDPELIGPDTPAMEKLRNEKYLLARMERMEREKSLVPAEHVQKFVRDLGEILKRGSERISRDYGNGALAVFKEMMDDLKRAMRGYE